MIFAKGGKGDSPTRTPDTLLTNDTVEALIAIGHGPIYGLKDGPKSFQLDDTPLQNSNGDYNFKDFVLDFWPGDETGHEVKLDLGGFSNPINVGVPLGKNTPVIRSGLTVGVDAFDFRVVIQSLVTSNDKGTFTAPLKLKFEWKKISEPTWKPCWTASTGQPTGGLPGGQPGTIVGPGKVPGSGHVSFEGDRRVLSGNGAPSSDPIYDDDLYYDTATGQIYGTQETAELMAGSSVTWFLLNLLPDDTFVDAQGVTRRLWNQNSAPNPALVRRGDVWRTGAGELKVWNGTSWVTGGLLNRPVTLDADGVWSIDEKVSSPTPKDIRIILPAAQNEPVEWRVTKLSDDSGTTLSSEVIWESVSELKRAPMTFYGVSMVRVKGQATDQFSRLPTWNGIYRGRIVRVPINYDPVARTYTGTWDGTYKLAWTNNPAWIFLDFVENDSYGLSSLYPHTAIKWKIYQWGQHCDEMVPRADGTLQPRWTYNDWIQEPREAVEMANYIAAVGGAKYIDDGSGLVDVLIDQDEDPVALFVPENVGPEGFTYTYTDRQTRANEIIVKFINPALNWQEDSRRIADEADIATYGRITDTFAAVGCTDVDEAKRRARRRLVSGLTEKEFVSFTTNRKGRFLAGWNVILVADPNMGRGLTGRISSVLTPNSVKLRDEVTLQTGVTYTAKFETPNPDYPASSSDPFKLHTLTVTTGSGTHSQLTFSTNLPAGLPEYAAFTIEAEGVVGLPKPYRILGIEDESGAGEMVRITALELNRAKYAFIDAAGEIEELNHSALDSYSVPPIAGLQIETGVSQDGATGNRWLRFFWERHANRFVRRYRVEHWLDDTLISTSEPAVPEFRIERAQSGRHKIVVQAVNLIDRKSEAVQMEYDVTGDYRYVPPPGAIALANGTTATQFASDQAILSWLPPADLDPNFAGYRVKIYTTGGVLKRTVNVGQNLTWTYELPNILADAVGRSFRADVVAIDQYGNESSASTITVTNPAPTPPTVAFTPSAYTIRLGFTEPTDADYRGIKVWVSKTNGFTPAAGNLAHNGKGMPTLTGLEAGVRYYVRYAFSDAFGDGTTSSQFVVDTPADAALAAAQEAASDGVLTPGDKVQILPDLNAFIAQQADLTAKATTLGVGAELTAYTASMSTLNTYLATLTTPVSWSSTTGNTTINSTTFVANYQDAKTKAAALTAVMDAIASRSSDPFAPRISYDFDAGVSGWTFSQAGISAANGVVTLNSTASDPQFISPTFSYAARQVPIVRARIRRTSAGGTWDGSCFWRGVANPSFSTSTRVLLANPLLEQNVWKVVEWDLSGATGFLADTITQLRLDFLAGSGTIEVDWVSIGRRSVDPLELRGVQDNADPTSQNTSLNTSNVGARTAAQVVTATDQAADAVSDGRLTPSEKVARLPIWQNLINGRAALLARATTLGIQGGTAFTAYDTARTELIAALPSGYDNLATTTTISNPSDLIAKTRTALERERELHVAISVEDAKRANWGTGTGWPTKTATQIDGAVDQAADAVSDGRLTPSEKVARLPIWQNLLNGRTALLARATALGIQGGTAFTAYDTARIELIAALPSGYDNLATTTTISNPSDLIAKTRTALERERELHVAISVEDAKRAETLYDGAGGSMPVANVLRPSANLIYNGGFRLGMDGWQHVIGNAWAHARNQNGDQLTIAATGTHAVMSQNIPLSEGQRLTVSAEAACDAGSPSLVSDVHFFNASGTLLLDGANNVWTSADGVWGRKSYTSEAAPAGTAYARVRFYIVNSVSTERVRFRRARASFGTQDFPFSDEATDFAINVLNVGAKTAAQVATAVDQAADAVSDGRLTPAEKRAQAPIWQNLLNGRTALLARATTLGIQGGTAFGAYDTARTELIAALPAGYDNLQTTTTVANPSDLVVKTRTALERERELLTAISVEDAKRSEQPAGDNNRVRYARMERGLVGWTNLWNEAGVANVTPSTPTYEGRLCVQIDGTFPAGAANKHFSLEMDWTVSTDRHMVPVKPGECLSVQVRLGSAGPIARQFATLNYLDANLARLNGGTTDVLIGQTFSATPSAKYETFATVPAGAAHAYIGGYVRASGPGDFAVVVADPMVTGASAHQTVHPGFAPGQGAASGATRNTGALADLNQILAVHVQDGQIVPRFAGADTSPRLYTSAGWTVVEDWTATVGGGVSGATLVSVTATLFLNHFNQGGFNGSFAATGVRLLRNGVVVDQLFGLTSVSSPALVADPAQYPPVQPTQSTPVVSNTANLSDIAPPAGTHTYSLEITTTVHQSAVGDWEFYCHKSVVIAAELKNK